MKREDYISKLEALIDEGKELVKDRPVNSGMFGTEENIQSEARCLNWFIRTKTVIEKLFGRNSEHYKMFVSFYRTREWTNLIGTAYGEVSFLKPEMTNQIAHMEALVELLKDGFNGLVDKKSAEERKPTSSVFLCHSSKDKPFVRKLIEDLEKNGIDVWYDDWNLEIGHNLTVKIQEGIESNQFLAIVLSPDAMDSEWVKTEWTAGFIREIEEKRVVVLPLLYKDCDIPIFLKNKIYLDFRDENIYNEKVKDLVGRIKGETRHPSKTYVGSIEDYKHSISCRLRGSFSINKGDMLQITRWFPFPDGPSIVKMKNLSTDSDYSGDEPTMTIQATSSVLTGMVISGTSSSGGEMYFTLGLTEGEYKKFLANKEPKKHPLIP